MDKLILLTKPHKRFSAWCVPYACEYVSTNKYKPHQGTRGIARRKRQLEVGTLRTN